MKVLVTGGNGFIGQYVVEELMARDIEPVIFDRKFSSGSHTALIFGDIKDQYLVQTAVGLVDGVIHLAGILGTQETIKYPLPAAHTNLLGGLNVMQACLEHGVPMVNIGVGNWWMENTYSITKNAVERFARMYATEHKMPITTVRAVNAYGPRQEPIAPWGSSKVRKIMPHFINQALDRNPIEIYGDGNQIMDMVYVSDLAKVLVTTLEYTAANGPLPTVECGPGVQTTVNDVAKEVWYAVKGPRLLVHFPMRPGEQVGKPVVADPATMSVIDMDASQFVSLEDGIERTVQYYRERRGQ